MSDLVLRDYQADDYPQVQEILQAAELFDEDYENEQRLNRWARLQPDGIVVAAKDDQIVGSVYFQDGVIPHIFRLAVKEEFREQGIGSALLEEAEKRARRAGHSFIELFIATSHPELRDFYGKRGYKDSGIYSDMVKQFRQSLEPILDGIHLES